MMTSTKIQALGGVLLLSALTACGAKESSGDQSTEEADASSTANISQNQMTIDASSEAEGDWRYFDLEQGTVIEVSDPQQDKTWDLGFHRFQIKSNSGISGQAEMGVTFVDQEFGAVSEAPAEGYRIDRKDGDDERNEPDLAFLQEGAWYDYNVQDHTLSPKARTYIVRTATGQFFKIQILGYYDDAGSSGHVSFQWQAINGPEQISFVKAPGS
jgi:hypothetical protein